MNRILTSHISAVDWASYLGSIATDVSFGSKLLWIPHNFFPNCCPSVIQSDFSRSRPKKENQLSYWYNELLFGFESQIWTNNLQVMSLMSDILSCRLAVEWRREQFGKTKSKIFPMSASSNGSGLTRQSVRRADPMTGHVALSLGDWNCIPAHTQWYVRTTVRALVFAYILLTRSSLEGASPLSSN